VADRLVGLRVRIPLGMSPVIVVCVVRYTYLPRADPLSRGFLLTVVCHCVWSRNITNEAAAPSFGCCFRKNTTDRCTCDVTLRRFHKSFLPWKCNKYYVFACVRARVRRVPGRMGVCMRVRASSLAYPACNLCAPCCDVICGPPLSAIFFEMS
jgi:hypothetical protein